MPVVDLPQALPDGSRLLHIGMPKTGTTALQTALDAARPALAERGVRNVSFGKHELKVALRAADTLPAYEGDWGVRRWPELAREFRESTSRITLWSSEALSQAKPERVEYLAEQLGNDLRIVVTLRPIVPLLVSQWQETLRRRGTQSLDDWLAKSFGAVTPEGEVRAKWHRVMPTLHRFSPQRVLKEWGAVFGEQNITFVVVDPDDRDRNFQVFERLLGVSGLLEQPQLDNASLPYPEAEMLRHFNRAYTARGADHPSWMYSVGTHGRVPLREFARHGERYPILAPAWAVEQSAAYTEAWVDALRTSDAVVVGNPDHLRERSAGTAEVAPPTMVDVARAGELADVLFSAAVIRGEEKLSRQRTSLQDYSGSELLAELRRRVKGRFRPTGK